MGVMEDSKGILGVFLKRNVIAVAGRAMAKNIRRLAPLVLPYSELVRSLAAIGSTVCAHMALILVHSLSNLLLKGGATTHAYASLQLCVYMNNPIALHAACMMYDRSKCMGPFSCPVLYLYILMSPILLSWDWDQGPERDYPCSTRHGDILTTYPISKPASSTFYCTLVEEES